MMQERDFCVDPSAINRWVVRFLPLLENVFHKNKRPVGSSWRMDKTYIKVKGIWKYLYRAVDKEGKTVEFLLTARRDKAAALWFSKKAMKANGVPEKVAMDKSSKNKAAIDEINTSREMPILVRQVKYLNNLHGAGPSGRQTHVQRANEPTSKASASSFLSVSSVQVQTPCMRDMASVMSVVC